jgi:hypothetical protein
MIIDRFIDDRAELLSSATGDQRKRKTYYEIDAEFEKMLYESAQEFYHLEIGGTVPPRKSPSGVYTIHFLTLRLIGRTQASKFLLLTTGLAKSQIGFYFTGFQFAATHCMSQ